MNTVSDRIKYAIATLKLDARVIAKTAGVAYTTWRDIESGKTEKPRNLREIAKAMGVSLDWLAEGIGPMVIGVPAAAEFDNDNVQRLSPHENGTLSKTRRLYVKGTAQMGADGYWYDLEYPQFGGDGYVDVPSEDPRAYSIRVRGDSMFPAIRDNWIVAVEPSSPLIPGEYVHVKTVDGRFMVKELLWARNGELALSSVNQEHGRLTLRPDEIEYAYFCWPVPPSKWRP